MRAFTLILAIFAALCALSAANEAPVRDPCKLKPKAGPCLALIPKWFYNQKKMRCQKFNWGGCRGVVPFDTKKECKSACKPKVDRCKLKPETGPCRARIIRWFWDSKSMSCKTFVWGGCKGVVPFKTKRQCQKAKCKKDKENCSLTPSDLLPPPGTITCAAFWTSYFFNRKTGKCESFSYSGCGPVGPYESKKECEEAKCECTLRPADTRVPPNQPICLAFWTRWFFDHKTGTCSVFSYSGCNAIGFISRRDCLGTCEMDS